MFLKTPGGMILKNDTIESGVERSVFGLAMSSSSSLVYRTYRNQSVKADA
jgi:hypothetical protein